MSVRPSRPRRPRSPAGTAPAAPPRAPANTPSGARRALERGGDGFEPRPARAPEARPIGERTETAPRPLRVVVTGYGDFAGVYNEAEGRPNPSSVLGRRLAELGLSNARVEFRHLEVTHGAVDAFMAEMRDNPPDIILSMGVSSKAQVEERPENWKSDAIDGHGNRIDPGPISDAQPARVRLSTDLPVDAIESALRQAEADGELPARTVGTDDKARTGPDEDYAPDASAYLCNYLNFRLTEAFGRDDAITAGFVHVTAGTTAEEMRVIAQAVVDHDAQRRLDAVIPTS